MKIKLYPDKPSVYVPDILFKDGTYPSKQAYIDEVRERERNLWGCTYIEKIKLERKGKATISKKKAG